MAPRTPFRPVRGRKNKSTSSKKVKGAGIIKKGAIGRAKLPKYNKKTQPRKLSVTSTESSDGLSDANGAASLEDDNDEDDDESDASAPSHGSRVTREAGRPLIQEVDDKEPMMFDTDEEQAAWFGDSEDDDEIYEGVDEISDEEVEEVNGEVDEEFLAAQFYDHPDVAANFLGDLETLSVFGFDEIDRNSFSSSSDSSDEAVVERRVHFEAAIERNPVSPELHAMQSNATILQAPRFSQEELEQNNRIEELSAAHRAFLGDPDEDSDLTDEELPAEAHTSLKALEHNHTSLEEVVKAPSTPANKNGKKVPAPRRGPKLGVFEFDGDKPWAVLDPSGTKVHIAPPPDTNRHDWLERKAQHALNQVLGIGSAESSPRGSLATLLDDSDRSVTSSQENTEALISGSGANLMMAGLSSGDGSANRFATGPPEAFYAPTGAQIIGDYLIDPEDLDLDEEDRLDPTGEGRLNIEDFIVCDGDSDNEETPASPTGPLPKFEVSTPTHKKADSWSHLNSENVMSFRRNTGPSSASHASPWNFDLPPKTPAHHLPSSPIPRKRKARSPPYQGEHYKDVTVVERKLITPRSKRQRANTMH